MDTDLITSPVGTINVMFLGAPVANKFKGGELEYLIKLEFDGTTEEGQLFKSQIEAINSAKVTKGTADNTFMVKGTTKHAPKVTDSEGNILEDIPRFPKGSTGKAVMVLKPAQGDKGNTAYLVGVALLDLDLAEAVEGENKSAALEALKAKIAKVK